MVPRKPSLIKLIAVFLTAAAVSQGAGEFLPRNVVLAQSFGDNPDSFPIPSTLPEGSTLKVDGSTSMRLTNEALAARFAEKFPDITVELDASRTDEALEALRAGEIDLLATGRPLTDAEKAEGLVEVPLEREKLAIIIGPDNPFDGNLTFEQFAQMFRGEITNWSEVGGPDAPIRFVDRPAYSDTRRALSTYTVFDGKPFETGSTADAVAEDETDAVINGLGADGIGYAVYSQVADRADVRILPMHQTLPDDPRYPYSQYRAFVYKEGAGPAALAFLGFATTQPGQEVIAEGAATAPSDSAATAEPETAQSETGQAETIQPETTQSETGQAEEEATALVPDGEPAGELEGRGFPWWWLLLGLLPLLGLLWWLLKGKGGAAPVAAPVPPIVPLKKAEPRIVLTPRNCRDAYAYWEIPSDRIDAARNQGGEKQMLRLYDVTGRTPDAPLPTPVAEFDCVGSAPDLHLPIKVDDRDYQVEVGYLTRDQRWLPLAKSDPVRVPACPKPGAVRPGVTGAALGGAAAVGAAAVGLAGARPPGVPQSRLVLTPRNCRDAYAYWEIPGDRHDEAKRQGGQRLKLRLYDVTNRLPSAPLPAHTAQFDCTGTESDLHVPIKMDDRDYVAEVGYLTTDNRWLPLAKSAPVRVPACEPEGTAAGKFPGSAVAAGAAALGAGAALGAAHLKPPTAPKVAQSRIVLTPRNDKKAYAYWEVPDTARAALKAEGGKDYQLRIYDVTDIDLNKQAPHSVLTYDVAETDRDRFVPLPEPNRDYIAEIGYRAEDGGWLDLARSLPVRPTAVLGQGGRGGVPLGVLAGGAGAAAAGIAAATAGADKPTPAPPASRIVLTPRTEKDAYAYWEVPAAAIAAAKQQGGEHYQLRLYDVTDIDLDTQPPHRVDTYPVGETDRDRHVPIPQVNRDYLAEIGYEAPHGNWIKLARSPHIHIPAGYGVAAIAGGAAAGAAVATSIPGNCAIQTVQVHSRHNAITLDAGQMRHIQEAIAQTHPLEPGLHILRIRDGVFNYDGDEAHPGEPFVLLWIYGGTVVNQKTGVPVNATWSTLNGYADTLTLDVREPATVCAFFLDTFPDDNVDAVILSVIKL